MLAVVTTKELAENMPPEISLICVPSPKEIFTKFHTVLCENGFYWKNFVSEVSALKVAERYFKIEDSIPKEWKYNPKQIHYLHGAGLPKHRVKQLVQAVIEKGGQEALQLADKPELEKMFLQFAYAESSH